jgi:hypothetical protein
LDAKVLTRNKEKMKKSMPGLFHMVLQVAAAMVGIMLPELTPESKHSCSK